MMDIEEAQELLAKEVEQTEEELNRIVCDLYRRTGMRITSAIFKWRPCGFPANRPRGWTVYEVISAMEWR